MARATQARATQARKSMAAGAGPPARKTKMGRLTMRAELFQEMEDKLEQKDNRWHLEVGEPLLFHFCYFLFLIVGIVWLVALVFLHNPQLEPCVQSDTINVEYVVSEGVCRDWNTANNDVVDSCIPWFKVKDNLGPVFNWVDELQSSNFFPKGLVIDGTGNQACFREKSIDDMIFFWLFVFTEVITVFWVLFAARINWHVIRRGARLLDDLTPQYNKKYWPKVDIFIRREHESCDSTMATLRECLELDYPPKKLHIYIADDGYLLSQKGSGANWPSPVTNQEGLFMTGDVREELDDFMHSHKNAPAPESGEADDIKTTSENFPDPGGERLPCVKRIDCALGYIKETYTLPNTAKVSFVARLKPDLHHGKAGAWNNLLYNCYKKDKPISEGDYIAFFDSGILPHKSFLLATLPFFYEKDFDKKSKYTDHPDSNANAFVQTPKYYKENVLTNDRGDPLGVTGSAFFEAGMAGMDWYGSVISLGTNCVWRRKALDSVGGFQYGTVATDLLTTKVIHNAGWDSTYCRKDTRGGELERVALAQGPVPESVVEALSERKLAHKGQVQLFFGVPKNYDVDPKWERPTPERPTRAITFKKRCFRKWNWSLHTLSWVNVMPLFHTIIVIRALIINEQWFYLNPVPSYCILIPRLILGSLMPSIGECSVPAFKTANTLREFYRYTPIRFLGTIEVMFSGCCCRKKKWGSTPPVDSRLEEVPTVLFTFVLVVLGLFSLGKFLFMDESMRLDEVIPVWSSSFILLYIYEPFAMVSVQEFFGWSYKSMDGAMIFQWFSGAVIMSWTATLMTRG